MKEGREEKQEQRGAKRGREEILARRKLMMMIFGGFEPSTISTEGYPKEHQKSSGRIN